MKNKIVFVILVLISLITVAQEKKVSNFTYIIVPTKFDFLKEVDQYQTSSLTKFLLKKNDFTALLDSEEFPEDLKNNRCKALTASLTDTSSFLKIKLKLELKDCFGKVLFASEGESKKKEFKKGYQEAIRNAHKLMEDITYTPLSKKEQIKETKIKWVDTPVNTVIKKEVLQEDLSLKKVVKKPEPTDVVLYAQQKKSGFQLINLKPEVVFIILHTNIKDVYVIKDKNGLLYKKETKWVAEYYENDQLVMKQFEIKF
ncbi:MAG: hypothetical protein ABF250_10270 [Polaribacter sp.]|uniref:hypothetical protein n=1 Tax=Polaribacter sp. TaxID=1920175 RepID=UPI00321B5CAF